MLPLVSLSPAQQVLEPACDLDEASFDKFGMVGETLNETVECRSVRQSAGEPAEGPEFQVVGKAADQGVGVGEIEDEGGDVGPPEGQEGIALAAGGAVLLEAVEEGRVVEDVEDGGELAKDALYRPKWP